MLFPAKLMNITNSKVCPKGEWSIIGWGFCECRNINVEVRVISRAEADNSYRDIDNSAYQKPESNICFILYILSEKNKHSNAARIDLFRK